MITVVTEKDKAKLNALVLAHIKKGLCPICGKDNPNVTVNDARYGKVKVCKTHKVAQAGVKG